MTHEIFKFPPLKETPEIQALRHQVRDFLAEQAAIGCYVPGSHGWSHFNPAFTRALARAGFIGMTWPKRFGGQERSPIERHVVTEELLVACAPVRAHWIADRQSGPLLLKFGNEEQCQRYLPRIAKGEHFFCIGMSEADSGSDLASIRTRAVKIDGGWRVTGAKLWTSIAHLVHTMILFARTGPAGDDRHQGVTQFLVDLDQPGISIRPITNIMGEHDFNEVVFEDVFVPDANVVGKMGNGWNQVTSELVYERSGSDRWLSTIQLLRPLLRHMAAREDAPGDIALAGLGRATAQLFTMHHMSAAVARLVAQGGHPATEAALVKDLGTQFERDLVEIARQAAEPFRDRLAPDDALEEALRFTILHSPSLTIKGGTREILRGIIAKGLGLR